LLWMTWLPKRGWSIFKPGFIRGKSGKVERNLLPAAKGCSRPS
jgi:hypothetical protein